MTDTGSKSSPIYFCITVLNLIRPKIKKANLTHILIELENLTSSKLKDLPNLEKSLNCFSIDFHVTLLDISSYKVRE